MILGLVIGAIGVVLFVLGARGRSVASHPHCAGCGFDLRGLAAQSTCPECGRDIRAPGAVSTARSNRLRVPMVVGVLTLGIGVWIMAFRPVWGAWRAYAPSRLLAFMVENWPDEPARKAALELNSRLEAGKLSAETTSSYVGTLMVRLKDPAAAWPTEYRSALWTAYTRDLLTDQQRTAYFGTIADAISVTARPRVRAGLVVPINFSFGAFRAGPPTVAAAVNPSLVEVSLKFRPDDTTLVGEPERPAGPPRQSDMFYVETGIPAFDSAGATGMGSFAGPIHRAGPIRLNVRFSIVLNEKLNPSAPPLELPVERVVATTIVPHDTPVVQLISDDSAIPGFLAAACANPVMLSLITSPDYGSADGQPVDLVYAWTNVKVQPTALPSNFSVVLTPSRGSSLVGMKEIKLGTIGNSGTIGMTSTLRTPLPIPDPVLVRFVREHQPGTASNGAQGSLTPTDATVDLTWKADPSAAEYTTNLSTESGLARSSSGTCRSSFQRTRTPRAT